MIQFNPPAVIDGFVIIDALLNNGIDVEPTNEAADYRAVVPPYIDGSGNFWLAVPQNQAIQTQDILDNLTV